MRAHPTCPRTGLSFVSLPALSWEFEVSRDCHSYILFLDFFVRSCLPVVNWYLGLWWSIWRISQLGRLNFMPHSMAQPAILPGPHLLSCPGHFQIWSNEIYWPVFIRIPDTGYLTVVILFLTGFFLPVENLISPSRVAPLFTPRVVSLFGFIFLRFFSKFYSFTFHFPFLFPYLTTAFTFLPFS